MVIERVIHCTLSCLSILNPLPHEVLLRYEDGVVVGVKDEVLLELLSKSALISFLYFSKDDYEKAIQGLTPPEVKEVINFRLKNWAPQALDQSIDRLHQIQRQCLALTAFINSRLSGPNKEGLQVHATSALNFLARLTNESRYDDLELTLFLIIVLEKEAELIAELEDAISDQTWQPSANEKSVLETQVQGRKESAEVLATTIANLGREEFHDSLPYVDLARAVWVQPHDANLVEVLKVKFEPFVEYKDGLVFNQPIRLFSDLERTGKKVSILYLNGGEFLESLSQLTIAQLERDFEEQASASASTKTVMRREFLSSLYLEQILLKKALHSHIVDKDNSINSELDIQIRKEEEWLLTSLAEYQTWISIQGDSTEKVQTELLKCEETLIDDIKLFLALARHNNYEQLEKQLQDLVRVKENDITRIKQLIGK